MREITQDTGRISADTVIVPENDLERGILRKMLGDTINGYEFQIVDYTKRYDDGPRDPETGSVYFRADDTTDDDGWFPAILGPVADLSSESILLARQVHARFAVARRGREIVVVWQSEGKRCETFPWGFAQYSKVDFTDPEYADR